MSERGRSPSSTTSSPGGSPSRHRSRQSRSQETKTNSKCPRTPPRHRHSSCKENDNRDKKSQKAKRAGKDVKKAAAAAEKKEDLIGSAPGSPCRGRSSRSGSQTSVHSNVGVAIACDQIDAASLFDKPIKQSDTNRNNKMEESRSSQISDSGVESMDSERLKSKVGLTNGDQESSVSTKVVPPQPEDQTMDTDLGLENKLSLVAGDGNSEEPEEDVSTPEESFESKYDLLPSATGKEFLGVLGYKRIDLLEDDKDVMASSIICTDGSDVEALSEVDDNDNELDNNDDENDNENRDSSDSIEILEPENRHVLKYQSDEQLYDASEGDSSHLKTIQREDENDDNDTSPSHEDLTDLQERDSSPVPLPVDAVVELRSTEPGALLGKPDSLHASDQDSDSHIDSDTSDGGAGGQSEYLNYEDVMSQLIYGYTKMTDSGIEQLGASGITRPDSLVLPRPMHRRIHRSESNSSSVHSYSSTEALIEAATYTPLHAQGTVDTEGEMIAFVAQDLAEKIRMSSPLTRSSRGDNSSAASYTGGSQTPSGHSVSSVNSMSSSASGWSNSSASGWSAISSTSGMSRSPSLLTQSPEDIPPIDPRAVLELELNARRVAENLDVMMANLKGSLNKMSALTVNCVGAYKSGIDNTCDSVDGAIKSMYALMAKCEELSKNMKPIYQLADQIKEIKRLLDLFEAQISREEKSSAH